MANRATTVLSGVGRHSLGPRQITARRRLIVVAISACFTSAPAWSNPTAPQVVNGSASFNQAGKLLTVTNSNGAIINWNTFSIGANETTRFNQASAASSVLNRVISNDPSILLGALSSNGKVWLVNPAGIMVGQGARIDVAGFVASTLNVRSEDFLAGRLNFGATPNAGSIHNYGQITTPSGGSVYLIAPAVENHGIINAPNGEVILAAGQAAQLIDTGTPGVKVDITGAEGNVTNLGEIVAEAGRIGMAGVLVKNSGTLNASSIVKEGGRIFLKAAQKIELAHTSVISADGTKGGQIVAKTEDDGQLSGELVARGDLSARGIGTKGSGGFIETSARTVDINSVRINTRGGTWLLDPDDVEINSAGTIPGATLVTPNTIQTALVNNDFIVQTSGTGGNGDISVNAAVAWSADKTLTLSAARNIAVNANISATGNSAGLNLYYGGTDGTTTPTGSTGYSLNNGASITLSGTNPTLWIGNSQYTVINSLGVEGDATGGTDQTLQGLARTGNLAGKFALGSNIDASLTSGWNFNGSFNEGFVPILDRIPATPTPFTGKFDGLGHTIAGLTIYRPSTDFVALFGQADTFVIKNVGLVGGSVTGSRWVGGLVGANGSGVIDNSYNTGSVTGTGTGGNYPGYSYVGGLVGANGPGVISNSYSTGSVTGTSSGEGIGGLVGNLSGGTISNSYSTGSVIGGGGAVGGLAGMSEMNGGAISNSYSTGSVTGAGTGAGGLAAGGLVGWNGNVAITNSYSTGSVSGGVPGGLVGYNVAGSVTNSYWNTETSGLGSSAGGTPLNTADMMKFVNFSSTWDIANTGGSTAVWRIYEGSTAPLLTSFLTRITLSPVYDGSAQMLTNISDYTANIASPVTAHIISTAAGLSLNSSATAGSHTAALSGFSSIQQGYDISYASSTITGTGSAANDLNIAASLGWSAGKLTLNAQNNINIGANLNGTGSASLALEYGQGTVASGNTSAYKLASGAQVNLPAGPNFSTKLGSDGVVTDYTVITSLGAWDSTTAADLQGMNSGLALNYALGSNIDASTTSSWNGTDGFVPVGTLAAPFTGKFDGLGHTITGLSIDRPATDYVGLFGWADGATIRNVGLVGGSVSGSNAVGALVGINWAGNISNSYSTGTVNASVSRAGGLAGYNYSGTISNSYATGRVSSSGEFVGGLTSYNDISGTIINSYSTGAVSGSDGVGGLVGRSWTSTITNSYSTGSVSGSSNVGGLVGAVIGGAVTNSYWDKYTSGKITSAGSADGAGLTTALMMQQASYPHTAGLWDFANTWGIVDGTSYPYLKSFFPNGPQVVSGIITNYGSPTQITLANNGNKIGSANMGANGFYYAALPANTLAAGDKLLAWAVPTGTPTPGGLVALTSAGHNTGLDYVKNALTLTAASGTLDTAALVTAKGSIVDSNIPYTVSGSDVALGNASVTSLLFRGAGSFNVTDTGTNIATLAANIGSLNFTKSGSGSLNVGSVGSVNGITAAGNIVITSGGTININGSITGAGAGSEFTTSGSLNVNSTVSAGAVAVSANTFTMCGGTWNQVSATLPDFNVTDFRITGGTFIRALGGDGLGAGTAYQLADIYGVQGMGSAGMLTKHYKLASDIDAFDTAGWNGGNGFKPVGNSTVFTGTFDGLGRSINDLTIHRSGESYVGLFGNNSGTIKDVSLVRAKVRGYQYVGALAANNSGTISNSSAAGVLDGGEGYSGGLVGMNGGSVTDSFAAVIVSGFSYGGSIGGLVGYNDGTVSESYATGSVTANANVGGLVGNNYGGSISISYVSGATVTGTLSSGNVNAGGLVGLNTGGGSISDSYVVGGSVNGPQYNVGGLVGYNYLGSITNSYASTSVVSGVIPQVGALIGNNEENDSVSNSFWNSDLYPTGVGWGDSGGHTGLTTTAMKQLASFSNWNTVTPTITNTGGSSATWRIYEGNTMPLLRSFLTPLTVTAANLTKTFDGSIVTSLANASYSVTGAAGSGYIPNITNPYNGAINVGSYVPGLYSTQQGYDISHVNGSLTINPAIVSANSINLSGTRAYDGTVNVAAGIFSLSGLISGQDLSLTGVGTVADKNVGVNKHVTLGSLTLGNGTNGLASNYTFTGGTQVATITPASLTVGDLTANTKVYDATTVATVSGTLTGVIAGDTVSLTAPTASFDNKNVGSAKPVTVGAIALAGADAANYSITPPTGATLAADITPASLTLSGLTAQNKVYDATTVATITGTAAFSGVLGADVVTLDGNASASFADTLVPGDGKNVGIAKPVSVTGLSLSGTDAGNYTLTSASTTSADITPASLTLAGLTAQNKVYDATTAATITGAAAFSGILGTDVVTLGGSASASFVDKNVGVAKPVSVTGLTLAGVDAGNYTLTNTSASTSADITPASLTLSGLAAQNKVYDATTVATIAGTAAFSGVLGTDVIALDGNATGNFTDKNVGVAKPVSVTGLTLMGADAGNYMLNTTAATSADITPASLTLNSVSAANKVYDATTIASVNGGSLSGLIGSDVVSVSGSGAFADKNVGSAKTVSVSGITLTGADAGNYTLSGTTAATTADITVRPVSTWIGGASGNWSVASNWDALPDLSNVLAVSVPTGSVTYDAAAGSTNLASLTAAGLNIAGGSLSIANNLTVSSSFGQAGGALAFGTGASASITQASGSLNVPALTLANLSLAAPAGAITQSGAIVAAALNTQSQTGTILTNAGNRVGSITAANSGSGNVALTNTGALTITTITNTNGNITVDNAGAVTTVGTVSAPAGTVSILAHSPLSIGAAGVSASGSIALTAGATTGSGDTLTLSGPVSSTGSGSAIALFAGDDLVQNANVTTNSGAVSALSQTGNINMALGTSTSTGGGSIGYSASSGNVVLTSLDAGSGAIALNAGKGVQSAPGFTGANLIGGSAVIVSGGSANLSTQVRLLDVTVEGKFSVTDLLTGTVFTDVPETAPLPILNQVVSTVVATTQQQPAQPTSQTTAPPPPPPPTTSGGSGPLLLANTNQTIGGGEDSFGGASGSGGDKTDKPGTPKAGDDKLASVKQDDDKKDDKKDDDKKKDEEKPAKKEDRPPAKKIPTCGR